MKRILQVPSLLVAVFLQLAPICRTTPVQVLSVTSPFAVVWQFVLGAVAVAGSFHAVSGATTLSSSKTASGKVGQAFNYTAKIFSDQHGVPRSYSFTGISPTVKNISTLGFVVDTLSGVVRGIPNKAGTFKISLTGWKNNNLSGDKTSFSISFVIDPGGIAPTISQQPLGKIANVGDTVVLRVTATGDAPFTYQWIRNGIELSGAKTSTLTFSPVGLLDDANYSVRVTNASGNALSATVHLTVVTPAIPPVITLQPGSVSTNSGSNVEFRIQATGTPSPTYQWFKNQTPLNGKISPALFLQNVTTNDEGSYSVRVSNTAATVSSSPALLTVFVAPIFTLQPSNQLAQAGTSVTFSTSATGKPSPSFQWFHENILLADSTNATLEVTASELTKGSYHALASNSGGSVLCSPAILTLEPTVAPTIPPLHIVSVGEINSMLEFTASPSVIYVIEYLDTLHGTQWVSAVTQSNSIGSVSVQVPNGENGTRCWRLRLGTN